MLLDDLKTYLVAMGAISTGWSIYEGFSPDDEGQTIAVEYSGGWPADTLLRENVDVAIQLRIRGGRFDRAGVEAKWQECFDLLQDASQISGSPLLLPGVVFIQAQSQAPLVWRDPKYLNMTVHFRVKRQKNL